MNEAKSSVVEFEAQRIKPSETSPVFEYDHMHSKATKHWFRRPSDGLCDDCHERPVAPKLQHARLCYRCCAEALENNGRLHRAMRDVWVRAA